MKMILAHCVVTRRRSALSWMVILLLNLIDCQDVIKLVTHPNHLSQLVSSNSLTSSTKSSQVLDFIRYRPKIKRRRLNQAMGKEEEEEAKENRNKNTKRQHHKSSSSSSSSSSRVVVLVKRSIPSSADNDKNNSASIVDPIEIIERVTNSTHDGLRSSLRQTRLNEIRLDAGGSSPSTAKSIKIIHRDDPLTRGLVDNSIDNNLISSIKSFLTTMTAKISLGAKSIIKIGNGPHHTSASINDVGENMQRPKRLSKPEFVQKILNDINISDILHSASVGGGRRSSSSMATKTVSGQSSLSISTLTSSSNDPGKLPETVVMTVDANEEGERFLRDKFAAPRRSINTNTNGAANELAEQQQQHQQHSSSSANKVQQKQQSIDITGQQSRQGEQESRLPAPATPTPPSRPIEQSAETASIIANIQANKQPGEIRGTFRKSTPDIFKENLSVLLEDQMEEWNTTSIDLDHLIKLHQQQTAKSFQPMDQLKKVMSFMHFG